MLLSLDALQRCDCEALSFHSELALQAGRMVATVNSAKRPKLANERPTTLRGVCPSRAHTYNLEKTA